MEHTENTAAGRPLSELEADARARQLINEAYKPTPTSFRDESELPTVGTTPPVAQPGRPPMSQKATDASALMLSGSVAALSVGGATSLVLYTLGQVDPVVLAVGAAGPVALVLAAGSLLRSVGRVKADMHTENHNHFNGPVTNHTEVHTSTKGMFGRTQNHNG
ncbi:hypothetical protein OG596_37430 [Streptomyces sp. NBC_01102]|uniref:hypothetical protein n=1 Tax=Streptomyces sp. NBC_01102 TaxID=2903749 RepID=UPI00386C5A2B|nr:hypothetical protein OG596_37430 [Streptomyces sp. NBC_01102]